MVMEPSGGLKFGSQSLKVPEKLPSRREEDIPK